MTYAGNTWKNVSATTSSIIAIINSTHILMSL